MIARMCLTSCFGRFETLDNIPALQRALPFGHTFATNDKRTAANQ